MGLWDKLTGELVDVIEWTFDDPDVLVYRYDRADHAIKYGAALTVRESQTAVFVNEGRIADVFPPGLYKLETRNLPLLTTLQSWPSGFDSPFKAEVYFVNTRQFTDLKWGTRNPVIMRDTEFGAVRLRAYGTYSIRINNPIRFLQEIAGTDGYFTTDEITGQLRNLIISQFSSIVGKANVSILDLAAHYDRLGEFIHERLSDEISDYGIELTKLLLENVSVPKEVEAALDRRTSMGAVGDIDQYLKYQSAEAMRDAALNPAGNLGAGVGMGMGMAMAERLGQSLIIEKKPATDSLPPALPEPEQIWIVADNQRQGPFSADELKTKITSGVVDFDTLVWTAGMKRWRPANEILVTAELLKELPPPVPEDQTGA